MSVRSGDAGQPPRDQKTVDGSEPINGMPRAVAHDFRNALSIVRFNLALLTGHDEEEEEIVRDCEDGLSRAEFLVQNLSRMSPGGEPEQLERMDVMTLLPLALADLEGALMLRALRMTLTTGGLDSAVVMASRKGMLHALSNALRNAIDYAPEASAISITLDVLRPGVLRLTVQDDGPSVPDDLAPLLFDLARIDDLDGYRIRTGKGLSLITLAAIVKNLDGAVSVDTPENGKGFRLRVELPLAP